VSQSEEAEVEVWLVPGGWWLVSFEPRLIAENHEVASTPESVGIRYQYLTGLKPNIPLLGLF